MTASAGHLVHPPPVRRHRRPPGRLPRHRPASPGRLRPVEGSALRARQDHQGPDLVPRILPLPPVAVSARGPHRDRARQLQPTPVNQGRPLSRMMRIGNWGFTRWHTCVVNHRLTRCRLTLFVLPRPESTSPRLDSYLAVRGPSCRMFGGGICIRDHAIPNRHT
jgi:hypothetical protein